jgi:hypothetical protein
MLEKIIYKLSPLLAATILSVKKWGLLPRLKLRMEQCSLSVEKGRSGQIERATL